MEKGAKSTSECCVYMLEIHFTEHLHQCILNEIVCSSILEPHSQNKTEFVDTV